MLVKVQESYRKVVAVCDAELLGKKFEEGNMQLDVNEKFYGGEKKSKEQVIKMLREAASEDATFNFVGKKAVETAIEAGVVEKNSVLLIQGIPHALVLI